MLKRLEGEAASVLATALGQLQELHLPGARALHRERLERALALSQTVLDAAERGGVEPPTLAGARLTRLLAHNARAQDGRHGAGQLSRSAQRAPTSAGCDEGWTRVEGIVANCEASADEAGRLAALLGDARAERAARSARKAAKAARLVMDQRNHAYTFHTDPSFSFGEGWYVAAAGVLAEIDIQIEADKPQSEQAEHFLRSAGLSARLVPYRSRPRANKALPDLVARAFAAGPQAAQDKLRAAFLHGAATDGAIASWADSALIETSAEQKKVLVWVRDGVHHPGRNSTLAELTELCSLMKAKALLPVLIGDALPDGAAPEGAVDLTLFWRLPLFQGVDMRRAQLQLFEHLRRAHALVGQIGVTTAGMDGPALMGLETMYLTQEPNPRLGRWVGAVPGYQEILRVDGYLGRIGETLTRWSHKRVRPT